MDYQEAAALRHSVRTYTGKQIEGSVAETLRREIATINEESGLHIQLVVDEPKAFGGFMAHYGSFKGVNDYIAVIGKDDEYLDEKCGYYGQRLVLLAQTLGLNSCWVYLTFKKVKSAFSVAPGEKLCLVIAIGYGATQGTPHKDKPIEKLAATLPDDPTWYREGIRGAMLAPTAINQQKFFISRDGDLVNIKALNGPCSKIDLGIVKYNFELFAGKENFRFS